MMIQSTTNNHLSFISNHCALGIFTLVKNPLQIAPFMQNKANLLESQMNVNKVLTKDYENIANCKLGENKANTKPIKAKTNPKQSQYKPNLSRRSTCCKSAEAGRSRIKPNFKRGLALPAGCRYSDTRHAQRRS
jgi:hypothetical protein